jgi:hypothetical protein
LLRYTARENQPDEATRTSYSIITQIVNITTSCLLESSYSGADVIIEPIITDSYPDAEFTHTSQYIQHSEDIPQHTIVKIKKVFITKSQQVFYYFYILGLNLTIVALP